MLKASLAGDGFTTDAPGEKTISVSFSLENTLFTVQKTVVFKVNKPKTVGIGKAK